MPYEVSVTEPLEVPTGNAVGVTLGSPERDPPNRIEHLVFVDAPQSLVRIYCGSAPIEFHLDVARTIAPLAADYSPPPFDPRVEFAEHGFAVDFGVEWSVSSRTEHLSARLLGGSTVLMAQTAAIDGDGPPVSRCSIEDATGVPGLTGLTSVVDWRAAIKGAATGTLHAKEPGMKVVELPSGPATRADWRLKLDPTTAWIVSDQEHVAVLLCSSERPPKDRWRSIAKTIEFLPADE